MQQHELKKYVEFTVYEKPDKMKKKSQKFAIKPAGKVVFKKDAQLVINKKKREQFSILI